MRRIFPLSPLFVAALGACSRSTPQDGVTAPPATEAAPQAAAAAEPPAARTMNTLAGQLAHEAEHRVSGPRVEDALAALARAGLTVPQPRQYLALVAGARYCAGGTAASGLAVSACEYTTAEEARTGVAMTERKFPQLVGTRSVLVIGSLSVALSDAGRQPKAELMARVRAELSSSTVAAR